MVPAKYLPPRFMVLVRDAADAFNITPEDVLGHSRLKSLANARHIVMWAMRKIWTPQPSFPEIGKMFGRDHTTIIAAVKRIDQEIARAVGVEAHRAGAGDATRHKRESDQPARVRVREKASMKQVITQRHEIDAVGNLGGGETTATGIDIRWQNGPLGRGPNRKEPNGAFVEGIIQAAIGRLTFYQTAMGGRFACDENNSALTKLVEALMWLEAREVEGTHAP